jgi:hypothetical protein
VNQALDWPRHLDHDLSQLVLLHAEFRSDRFANYPETVQRALHSRRPNTTEKQRASYEDPDDLKPRDFAHLKTVELGPWTASEVRRICDADKLLAHLSKSRDLLAAGKEWGSDEDRDLWIDGVRSVAKALGPTLLPLANAALEHLDAPAA